MSLKRSWKVLFNDNIFENSDWNYTYLLKYKKNIISIYI